EPASGRSRIPARERRRSGVRHERGDAMTKRALTTVVVTAALLVVAVIALFRLAPWNMAALPPDLRFDVAGEYRVGVWPSPDPARTGENAITVVVRDRDGRPVRDA